MNPNEIQSGGNLISATKRCLNLEEYVFENLKVRWSSAADRIEIATVSGVLTGDYVSSIHYGAQSLTIVPGAGILANIQGTPLNITTTWQILGDPNIVAVEYREHYIMLTTGERYILTVVRKGTNTTDGYCEFFAEKKGTATNQNLTAGYGIDIVNGVVQLKNEVYKTSPIATAQTNTLCTLGDFQFRASLNATNPNLDIRSITTLPVNIRYTAQEWFTAGTATNGVSLTNTVVNGSAGAFITLNGSGAGNGEFTEYRITTANNRYWVYLDNFGDTNISLYVKKAI